LCDGDICVIDVMDFFFGSLVNEFKLWFVLIVIVDAPVVIDGFR